MLKVLVVDDDPNMRNIINKILGSIDEVEVVGEAENGAIAVEKVEELKVDAVFMDVDMPIINGVESAKLILDMNPKCFIVFITAHETYMPEAFEMYAFDYILKPFKVARIKETIGRILNKYNVANEKKPLESKVIEDKILLKNSKGIAVIKPEDIIFVSRENRSTYLYTVNGQYKCSESLCELINKLPDIFIRTHKSYIVNIERIDGIEPYGRWTYVLKFKGMEEDALITKEKLDIIMSKFKFRIN